MTQRMYRFIFNRPTFYNPNQEITSVNDQQSGLIFNIYPNPTKDKLNLLTEEEGLIVIYDLSGRLLIQKSIFNKLDEIDVSSLATGTYLLHFYSENLYKSCKFIKD